jgi:hypothetical protein
MERSRVGAIGSSPGSAMLYEIDIVRRHRHGLLDDVVFQLDIERVLCSRDIRLPIRIAVRIVFCEDVSQRLGLRLGDRSGDRHRFLVMRRLQQPAYGTDMIGEEVDNCRAMRREHIGPHRPEHGLDPSLTVGSGEELPIFVLLGHQIAELRQQVDEIDFALIHHRRHVVEIRLDGGEVLILESVHAEHDSHRRIAERADRVRRDDFALDILDLLNRAVAAHDIGDGAVAGHAILENVGDRPDIEMGVVDGEGERLGPESRDIELVGRHRLDLRRRTLEMDALDLVGLAEIREEIGVTAVQLVYDRLRMGRRRHPADTHLPRIGMGAVPETGDERNHARPKNHAPELHGFTLPYDRLSCFS